MEMEIAIALTAIVSIAVTRLLMRKQSDVLKERISEAQLSEAGGKAELAKYIQLADSVQQQLTKQEQQSLELNQKIDQHQQNYNDLLARHAALKAEQAERDKSFRSQLENIEQQKENIKKEFENLANKIFDEKGKNFSQANQATLDSMLKPFKEQMEGFQKRVNEVHSASVKDNTNLAAEIKKVLEVGLKMESEAVNLTSALKGDTQQRGAWGEAQLERTLQMSGLLKDQHYTTQDSFGAAGNAKRTDYIIRLPDEKCLVIDSKMTLADYDRSVSAATDEELNAALKAHVAAVKKHIDDLAKKDYTDLPGILSPDFILMFMPIEPAYIEALKFDKELFSYGYEKNIILVSHTTLIPILRTVSNLWTLQQSNEQAKDLGDQALAIYNSVCTITERVYALGQTLGTAGEHYNKLVTGLVGNQGLAAKVDRFGQLSTKAKKQMKVLEPKQIGGEDARLKLTAKPLTFQPADEE
ncbi:MAG: DNA recombination protein RmuC [Pseudomonadota bacterium]|nr:DNA recombination protein RmuC [Pseudomonadota bacterium]